VAYRTTGTEVTRGARTETAVYGTVRTVVWEDGGGDPASYPLPFLEQTRFTLFSCILLHLPVIIVLTSHHMYFSFHAMKPVISNYHEKVQKPESNVSRLSGMFGRLP